MKNSWGTPKPAVGFRAQVANGSTRLALTLLHAGADPSGPASDGRTPLHVLCGAAAAQRPKLLEALIHAGADVNARRGPAADAPLHAAARAGAFDVVAGLVGAGANAVCENGAGLTPAEVAALELSSHAPVAGVAALERCADFLG